MVLVPLGVISLKISTAGTFAVLFRVLSRKKYDRKIGTLWGRKKVQATPAKKRSWYFLGVLFKISDKHPHMESPSPGPMLPLEVNVTHCEIKTNDGQFIFS